MGEKKKLGEEKINYKKELKNIICFYYKGTLGELEEALVSAANEISYTGSLKRLERMRKQEEE
jgi:hypothetical protein